MSGWRSFGVIGFFLAAFLSIACAPAVSVEISGTARVSNVVDGDTYWLTEEDSSRLLALQEMMRGKNIRGDKFKVRLLAIDTAESRHSDSSRNTDIGRAVSAAVKSELTGKTVSYVCVKADFYGRALCSVSLDGQDYGRSLIARGLSPYWTKYGKHPWLDNEYAEAQAYARASKNGIWANTADAFH